MLTSIEIRNFKAIKDKPLILNGLTNVNYLVGENGSGKSSVLEGMWQIFNGMHGGHDNDDKKRALNVENQYSDTETQFNKKSEFKFVYQNQKENQDITLSNFHYETTYANETVLVWDYIGNEYLRNRIYTATSLLVSDQNFRKSLLGNYYQKIQSQLKDQSYADFNKIAFRSTVMQPEKNTKLLSLKELFYDNYGEKGFNQEKFNWLERNYKEKIQNILPFLSSEEKLILSSNFNTKTPKISENLSLGDLSDGTLRLMSLFYLEEFIIEGNFINGRSENLFILIEEPENNLHPELQKQVPVILNQLHKNLSEKATKAHNSSLNPNKCLKYPIQFLISTHSPFIISAAGKIAEEEKLEGKDPSQKVYLIENGQCLNPQGNSGKEVKHKVATKMLGAEIKDFTPSKIVFCAKTEQVFLELINDTFYNLDIVFKTTKPDTGDSTLLKVGEVQEILKYGINYYEDTEIFFYRDSLSDTNDDKRWRQQLKSNQDLKDKAILSDKSMFELKFIDDETEANLAHENAIENAKLQANKLIEKGEAGKSEFQNLFPELNLVFDFF
jgi:hypothetical protein